MSLIEFIAQYQILMRREPYCMMSFTRRLLSQPCEAFFDIPIIGCLENLVSNTHIKNLVIKVKYHIYQCISRPFMASKEAPKITLDLYMGQRFQAKFQLNNLSKINIIMRSLGITNAVDKSRQKTSK